MVHKNLLDVKFERNDQEVAEKIISYYRKYQVCNVISKKLK